MNGAQVTTNVDLAGAQDANLLQILKESAVVSVDASIAESDLQYSVDAAGQASAKRVTVVGTQNNQVAALRLPASDVIVPLEQSSTSNTAVVDDQTVVTGDKNVVTGSQTVNVANVKGVGQQATLLDDKTIVSASSSK